MYKLFKIKFKGNNEFKLKIKNLFKKIMNIIDINNFFIYKII